jgi:hypothetical protein
MPDLERHRRAVAQPRAVDLRDRGGPDGLRVDRAEHALGGAERLAQRRLHRREGQGRGAGGERGELGAQRVGQGVGAQRELLTQLGVDPAQLAE